MVGNIFITRNGYDPQLGKHVKDPYLDAARATLGACRPDVRRRLVIGDHIFVISGKVPGAPQFVMCAFEIAAKITALDAFRLFPELRLRQRKDGQLTGNVIVDANGHQHELDDHKTFARRVNNYVVGKNVLTLQSEDEIAVGREQTLDALRDVLHRSGKSPIDVVGRWGANLTEEQVHQLRHWLEELKRTSQAGDSRSLTRGAA
ncbi:MAG: hypothetical protein ACRD3J_21075 [Thermoanaerobaculia bacterium]